MNYKEARKLCEAFAISNKLIFDDEGECGFGRECVGFLSRSGNWLSFNPIHIESCEPIDGLQCKYVDPPYNVNNYHKHNCMAVIGRGDEAIIELASWVQKINKAGNVRIVEYETGATGLQALISGVVGYTILAGK